MDQSHSKLYTVFILGLMSLVLASCAMTGPVAATSKPESLMSEELSASETIPVGTGDYLPYEAFMASRDKYANSRVVLFFNAVWCSTCQEARENIEANLSDIPKDLAIVVVDFDNSIDLRKKYGVTVQHTFIEIDSEGNPLGKWSGSVTVRQIVEQLS